MPLFPPRYPSPSTGLSFRRWRESNISVTVLQGSSVLIPVLLNTSDEMTSVAGVGYGPTHGTATIVGTDVVYQLGHGEFGRLVHL